MDFQTVCTRLHVLEVDRRPTLRHNLEGALGGPLARDVADLSLRVGWVSEHDGVADCWQPLRAHAVRNLGASLPLLDLVLQHYRAHLAERSKLRLGRLRHGLGDRWLEGQQLPLERGDDRPAAVDVPRTQSASRGRHVTNPLHDGDALRPLARHAADHLREEESQAALHLLVLALDWRLLRRAVAAPQGIVNAEEALELLKQQTDERLVSVVPQQHRQGFRPHDAC